MKTGTPRSANLPQMPRGLVCKLRQRGQGYGGRPAGSRGIDPSLQLLPLRSNYWGRPLWTGGIPATQPRNQAKPQFRPRLSGMRHWCCAVRWPALHLRVAYFGQHRSAGTGPFHPATWLVAPLQFQSDPFEVGPPAPSNCRRPLPTTSNCPCFNER